MIWSPIRIWKRRNMRGETEYDLEESKDMNLGREGRKSHAKQKGSKLGRYC